MADVVTPEVRSRMMAGIRGRNTRPELLLRKALHARGFRYRIADKRLPGSPDIVLPKYRVVIFVHGCFWHRHPGCSKATTPASNTDFWQAKFAANVARDERNLRELHHLGWRTAIVWECAIGRIVPVRLVDDLKRFIEGEVEQLDLGATMRVGN